MYFIITKDKNQLQPGLNSGETYSFSFNPSKTFESNNSDFSVYPTYDCFIRTVIYPNDIMLTKPHTYSLSFGHSSEYVKFKFNSNKILVGEAYPLYDIKTIKKFNIKISDNYVIGVSAVGNINVLEYLNKWNIIQYCKGSLTYASGNGQIKVLTWWYKSGMPLKYDEDALMMASENGYVEVLEWWFRSGLKLKYNSDALSAASCNGHVNVLIWWHRSGLKLKYNSDALTDASEKGHVNVLEWWLKSGLKLKYDEHALHWASQNGHVNVLEWWLKSGLPLKCNKYRKYYAHRYGCDEKVVQWWKNSGLLDDID